MRWLVTGAGGQLGQSLIDHLNSTGEENLGLSRTELDICNEDQVAYWLESFRPDVVANVAAYTDVNKAELEVEKAFQVNSMAVGILASRTRDLGTKFLHFSTDYVFSGDSTVPWKTNSTVNPQSSYGRSKASGEALALALNKDSLIIRTSWLYSKYSNNFVKKMLSIALSEKRTIEVVNDQLGQPTNAKDLVELSFKAVAEKSIFGLMHASNSGEVSWYDYAKDIFEISGADPSRVRPIDSERFQSLATRPKYSVMDNSDWSKHNLEPLRPWRESLESAIPEVIKSLNL